MFHIKAARAREAGAFDAEIVPVMAWFQEVDKKMGEKISKQQTIAVTQDDGIRTNISPEALAKLKPTFKTDGTTTTVGCAPDEMGIGPALAIPQLLEQHDDR
ncbi:unnamed protein product [Clonostachys byssicola]|uniref:Thiolase N-terminal domain-containing protein n=1 Tax=Clonostachys byssicola TaxID=160290 RepID=A0A9N9UGG2_9HYPO|nr:unnamed protein product [Clonostachys byssicola]